MTFLEEALFWYTVAVYLGSSLFNGYWFIFQKQQLRGRTAEKLLIYSGLLSNTAAVVVRALRSGHLPLMIDYESNLIIVLFIVAGYVLWRIWKPAAESLGIVAIPLALLILLGGYVSDTSIQPLTPDYFSRWMVLHVIFTILAVVCLVFAVGISVLYLMQGRYPAEDKPGRYNTLPFKEFDHFSLRLVLYGFICWTVMMITGTLWAKDFWGKYWSWDPIETWSFISWLAWGIYIHLRLTHNWQGRKLAWLCIVSFLVSIVSLWGMGIVAPGSYHNLNR